MTAQGIRFTLAATLVALLVGAIALLSTGAPAHAGVLAAVGLAWAVQVVSFWVFSVWVFAGRPWLAYGMGMLVRFALFAAVALLVIPRAGFALAPTLFSLVAVFWLTTMLEPAFLKPRPARTA